MTGDDACLFPWIVLTDDVRMNGSAPGFQPYA